MPRHRNDPLTPAQRALAAEPRYLALAGKIARPYAREYPRLASEFRSEGLLALCQAARTFEPDRGLKFSTHATNRIEGAMLDVLRGTEPCGFRRRSRRDVKMVPRVVSLSTGIRFRGRIAGTDMSGASDGLTVAHLAQADEDEVGWEADYQERLAALTRSLPPRHRAVLRMMYGRADLATMRQVGRALGISESRVSQVHGQALRLLEEA
jgi:RNA polymerase sigma factor FliA